MHTSKIPEGVNFGFIRDRELAAIVPVSRATRWRWVKAGKFPKPVKLTDHITAWRVQDVRQWCEQFAQEAA
jgi:predicted DNA-binding transcriptional regulator AlpA